ncbi:MAG: hypothetical protein AAB217_16195 [Chloroflexota bacterium]
MKTQSLPLNFRPPALILAAVCAVVALALAVSPAARAAVSALIKEIGGISFNETDQYPGFGDATPALAPEETMSLAEAQTALPFTLGLPTWVPQGFVQDEMVQLSQFSEHYRPLTISWRKATAGGGEELIRLSLWQGDVDWIVGPDSVDKVLVNGEPAGLTRGVWNANTQQWDANSRNLTLTWTKSDVTYQLWAFSVSVEDLIRMAESIP